MSNVGKRENLSKEGFAIMVDIENVVFSHSNTVVLEDLQPFTLYNISVSAYNGDQQGPYSRPIYVQTKEDGG